MKNYYYPLLIFNILFFVSSVAQELPLGYILQYKQDFSKKKSLDGFNLSSGDTWVVAREKQNFYLEFSKQSSYNPAVKSPKNIGILSRYIFGDFILEADLQPAGRENDSLDICIFFGMKDSLLYYYVHLTSYPADSQNICIVNNSDQKEIPAATYERAKWVANKWHKLRIERNIVTKTITVFVDNLSNPLIIAKDRTLMMGYIGFGSYNGPGRIDNINIYAPTAIHEETEIFKSQ
jgi:hypothetical protein